MNFDEEFRAEDVVGAVKNPQSSIRNRAQQSVQMATADKKKKKEEKEDVVGVEDDALPGNQEAEEEALGLDDYVRRLTLEYPRLRVGVVKKSPSASSKKKPLEWPDIDDEEFLAKCEENDRILENDAKCEENDRILENDRKEEKDEKDEKDEKEKNKNTRPNCECPKHVEVVILFDGRSGEQ